MKVLLITFGLLFLSGATMAQEIYDASLIPKNLLPYASAVVRNKEETVEVKALDNVIVTVKAVVTVLNKNGNDLAHIAIWHNKGVTIRSVKGVVYDAYGKKINKFSEKDFADVSAANNFSLFEDSRVEHYIPSVTDYPYTIAYEYETRSQQSLDFQDWRPNRSAGMAIEKSSFTFICKPDFNIRYKESNLPEKAIITNTGGLKTYLWHLNNVKAVKDEPYSPNPYSYISSVKIAPEKFSYEGINGSFTNWNELGKWVYDKLLINRDKLPDQTVAYIKNLTKEIADPKEKARKIYEYMQQKTHYISVQVGIGGYQPFKAEEVDKLSYGDCKALVNYTQALLKVANIDSYYCVVDAGGNKISLLPDFASMDQGNHIILCLPFKNDTTWLECTNQKKPFGFLGDFTDDRTVLACTPNGGIVLHTPKYTAQINSQIRKGNFNIKETGELSGDMETIFKGVQYDDRESIINSSETDQIKALNNIYPINNLEIEKFNFKQDKSVQPVTTEYLKLTARDYASNTSHKLYFLINAANRNYRIPKEVRNRQTDFYINEGYTDEDEINYTIPKGYHLEKFPLNVNLNNAFGSYTAKMDLKGDKLSYKRKLQLLDGNYSKDTYQDLVDFYEKVVNADAYSVTLVKDN
jgi:transglutaminase-like putative cysteine protease